MPINKKKVVIKYSFQDLLYLRASTIVTLVESSVPNFSLSGESVGVNLLRETIKDSSASSSLSGMRA